MTDEETQERIINLEMLLAQQDRLLDDLSAEILRLNQRLERLSARFDAEAARRESSLFLRPLSEEPPPPHY